ncbi:putative peptidase family-domain-containing protein [Xylariaceae sp. FL0594]|nr:putative peptidase family-domain-containing protein [Xylariaceae sp. FL0594]
MAPKFSLKDLRRISRTSFRTNRSTETSSNDEQTSSQEVSSVGSITPPSISNESDPALHIQIPAETRTPPDSNTNSKRYSLAESFADSVASDLHSTKREQVHQNEQKPGDQERPLPYAPRITNIRNRATVHEKLLLVVGVIGDEPEPNSARNGTLVVSRPDNAFPTTHWTVVGGRFKALVYLLPGPNLIEFEFRGPGASASPGNVSSMRIQMLESKTAPPLQLAILVGKDSPGTFDSTPARVKREGNDLDVAIRKFRTAAYLWQSFTAEQMSRQGFDRRTFRFDEEWTTSILHRNDFRDNPMRSEARVHLIRMEKNVAEIRSVADAKELRDIAAAAVRDYFGMKPGQKQYVAALILDSHWDSKEKVVRGHAAFGGKVDDGLHLAMFGSHCLHSYPSTICEILPALSDCTQAEGEFVTNEAGSSWETAVLGIGAHLHEVGHLLGCPRQESGVMAGEFLTLHRTFAQRNPYSTRTRTKGGPVQPHEEPTWHKLDLMRFRYHPMFLTPNDRRMCPDATVCGWSMEDSKMLVAAKSGLLCTEIFTDDDRVCHIWIEYPRDVRPQREVVLTRDSLLKQLPEDKRRSKLRVVVRSMAGGELVIEDFHHLCSTSTVKMPSSPGPLSKLAFRSTRIGAQSKDSELQDLVFNSAAAKKNRIMTSVIVYHGHAVDGLEFHYDDGSSQLLGKRSSSSSYGEKFTFNVFSAEVITGFVVRAGDWIDAVQILTSTGRKSKVYGKAHGGTPHTLFVPGGFKVCAYDKQKDLLASPTGHFSLLKALHMADYITELNGFCGVMSVFSSLRYCLGDPADKSNLYLALAFLPFGLFFDFMDGRVARWRKKSSMMGQELDSLADLISFGLAPACVAFSIGLRTSLDHVLLSVFVLCGLTRLARFNVTAVNIPKDATGKASYFEGTPIPTTLGLDALMAWWVSNDRILGNVPGGVWFAGSAFEVHPVVFLFVVHGCLMCSKTLHVPKP